jgi:hypothetical protein
MAFGPFLACDSPSDADIFAAAGGELREKLEPSKEPRDHVR